MRLSEERKAVLTVALDALNKTVGGKMSDIIAAEAEVKKHLPKIGLYLEYSDYTNRWFFADRNGDEVDLTTDFQRKMNNNADVLAKQVLDLKFMEEIKQDIRRILVGSVSAEYIKTILDEIENDIIGDVVECSSYKEDGLYNEDDIRLAIGRVLLNRMGIIDHWL